MATATELLTKVEAWITARLDGRPIDGYTVHGVTVRYPKVSELMDLRTKLKKEAAIEDAGGMPATYAIPRARDEQ